MVSDTNLMRFRSLLHFSISFFMCSPHVSFLSNVIPKNVIWSLNSISLPNKVSFCNDPMIIFLLENIMALVLKAEILKPQSWDHISILPRADWILFECKSRG